MVKQYDFQIVDAENIQVPLRLALDGPSGSGKTFTALKMAQQIASSMNKVIVIDSENGSSVKYRSQFPGFKVINLTRGLPDDYEVERYIAAMKFAMKSEFEVVIVDSLSHAWAGPGGFLEQVDKKAKTRFSSNSWAAYSEMTPIQNNLINTILHYKPHLIVTMRSKQDYDVEKSSDGKTKPVKRGTKPIQRDGMDYEFDVVIHLEQAGRIAEVTKTRHSPLAGKVFEHPGSDLADELKEFLAGVDPDTLPLSRDAFIKLMEQDYGATQENIRDALQAANMKFSYENSRECVDIVAKFMETALPTPEELPEEPELDLDE